MKHLDAHGARIPALGFGTWRLTGRTCSEMVQFALAEGYRHIDTAAIYANEEDVGRGIAAASVPRSEIFLTTKVWSSHLDPDALRRSAEASLAKLGTDYVDLLLIHWPDKSMVLADTLGAMQALQAEGKVRHIGVSNFNVALMRTAVEELKVPIVANQVEYHPFLSQRSVLDYCRQAGMTLTAYCPLAIGRAVHDPVLLRIGEKHDRSAAQVTLRWLIEQDNVSAIPKAGSPKHCRANLEIFDFALDAEDHAAIGALACGQRLTNMRSGFAWDPD